MLKQGLYLKQRGFQVRLSLFQAIQLAHEGQLESAIALAELSVAVDLHCWQHAHEVSEEQYAALYCLYKHLAFIYGF